MRKHSFGHRPFKRLPFRLGLAVGLLTSSAAGYAQGVPVIDVAGIAQMIQQLQQMQQQYKQLQDTHNSFNKLTNMGDIAALLNNPDIRKALPGDFNSVQSALMGNTPGASQFYTKDTLYSSTSGGAYAAEIERQKQANAGAKSVGQTMYDAASQRIEGLETLRKQIGQSEDPKTIADLQARLTMESAAAQQDVIRLQALAMVQSAQDKVELQRRGEATERRLDAEIARFGGSSN